MKVIFKRQMYHLLIYVFLGFVIFYFSEQYQNSQNRVLGLNAFYWVLISWIAAGVMQLWILLFWRLEFYYKKISERFGSSGFAIYRTGFIFFSAVRILPLIPISFLTGNSLPIHNSIRLILILVTTPFILWGLYSVFFYFGVNRAFGADHFFPEYRTESLEKRGTFKYIPNSMYTIVLLLLYHPGLYYVSSLGLIIALSQHLFVWTHYFCTEKPDLKEIYGGN